MAVLWHGLIATLSQEKGRRGNILSNTGPQRLAWKHILLVRAQLWPGRKASRAPNLPKMSHMAPFAWVPLAICNILQGRAPCQRTSVSLSTDEVPCR
jgi:hypothetical protein